MCLSVARAGVMIVDPEQDYVLSVAVSHDGQWVVSGSKDRGVQFWDAKTAIVQFMLQGHKNSGPLSPPLDPTPVNPNFFSSYFDRSQPRWKRFGNRFRRLASPYL